MLARLVVLLRMGFLALSVPLAALVSMAFVQSQYGDKTLRWQPGEEVALGLILVFWFILQRIIAGGWGIATVATVLAAMGWVGLRALAFMAVEKWFKTKIEATFLVVVTASVATIIVFISPLLWRWARPPLIWVYQLTWEFKVFFAGLALLAALATQSAVVVATVVIFILFVLVMARLAARPPAWARTPLPTP